MGLTIIDGVVCSGFLQGIIYGVGVYASPKISKAVNGGLLVQVSHVAIQAADCEICGTVGYPPMENFCRRLILDYPTKFSESLTSLFPAQSQMP